MAAHVADDPVELLALATEAAREGGAVALAGRRSTVLDSATKSSLTDLVTQFDRDVEAMVVERVLAARPGDAIVGEEGAAVSGESGFEWLIDPIDGTTNYVYDLPAWCTSVAVTRDGVTLAGAVYVPPSDELYAASAGGGASLNGRPIQCGERDELALALVATGFAYQPERRAAQAARLAAMIGSIRDIRRLGSAAIDLCHVGAGRVDAYFEEHLNAWDAAAGELIAREAGCRSSDFDGGAPAASNLVVAAPGVHAALLELLAASVTDR